MTMTAEQRYKSIFNEYIKREGAQKLLDWLSRTDFFTAPASAKFHNAFEGGLVLHSLNVFDRLLREVEEEYGENFNEKYSMETITVCALLHDICKVNFYKKEIRNVKENGEWVPKTFYTVEDELPYGHGEKSVYIVSGFIKLTRSEAMAINWHMGGFDTRVKGGDYSLSAAFYSYPLALLLHIADNKAAYLDEERYTR